MGLAVLIRQNRPGPITGMAAKSISYLILFFNHASQFHIWSKIMAKNIITPNDKSTDQGCSCGSADAKPSLAEQIIQPTAASNSGCCGGSKVREQSATDVLDPVCGMMVSPATARTSIYKATNYFFCSSGCLDLFEASPTTYVSGAPRILETHHG